MLPPCVSFQSNDFAEFYGRPGIVNATWFVVMPFSAAGFKIQAADLWLSWLFIPLLQKRQLANAERL